jgi:virginiamycin B lyase
VGIDGVSAAATLVLKYKGRLDVLKSQFFAAAALAAAMLSGSVTQAQYTAKDWPDGPMKQRFTSTCGGCHDINRVRVGHTPEGWLTVTRMMQNMAAPVPAEEWPAMTEY